MKKVLAIFIFIIIAFACENVKDKAKNTVNKSGEAVGETATEFFNGVKKGVDNTLDSKIIISDELKDKGISIGKYYIENDSLGKDNKLLIYIITEQDYEGVLTFKVFDKNNAEYGRQKIEVNSKAGDAAYHDVMFDSRTDIESKSTIKIN